ncbi:MAG TPA: DUF885 domain-containing protein [Steroidobacteraceae bacterium]|nr:DUF885 domain-containing protein [Steroidobacteraceae bacterium]
MRTAFAAVLLSALLAACGQKPAPAAESGWPAFVQQFVDDFLAAHPTMAFAAGRKEYAGQLPDWSREGIAAEIARLKGIAEKARAFDDAGLTDDQRFERDYLLAVVDRNLFWLEKAEWPFRNPTFYFDWGLDFLSPDPYLTKPYAPPEQRLQDFTRWLDAIPAATAQIRANLRAPMPRSWIDEGIANFGGMVPFLRDDAPRAFAEVKDEALQKAYAEANGRAIAAFQSLADWLEAQRATQTEDFAIGAELFAEMLKRTEGVDIPLDRLKAIGEADLARNLAALDEACREFAPGTDRKGCTAKMKSHRPEGGAVEGARKQLDVLRAFVVDQKLATIPSDDPILVDQAPPYQATNFAYINPAGPYDVGMPSTYYIAPPDPTWPKAKRDAYTPGVADLMSTSVHEVWPGHFLHSLHWNRAKSLIARLFPGYSFTEGWAHYAEEMMWEAGLSGGLPGGRAEYRVGQLSKALYRDVRYLCAIGMHTQGMKVADCEKMFLAQAFQDPGNAQQQAARGTYDPGYLNYTLGKLMILKLRDDWTASRGGRAAWGEFHDRFLSFGGPPVPMVRKAMLGADAGPAL